MKRDPNERAIIYVNVEGYFYDLDGSIEDVIDRLQEMKKELERDNPDRVEPVRMHVDAHEEYERYGGSSIVGKLEFIVRRPENDEEYAHRLNNMRDWEKEQRIRDEEEFSRLAEKLKRK